MKYNQLEREEGMGGITSKRHIIRDWHYCPRCRKRAIDRIMRKCNNCQGMVLFADTDDGRKMAAENIHTYVWMRSIFGLWGYYDHSFFDGK